jgi:hypothetical protein
MGDKNGYIYEKVWNENNDCIGVGDSIDCVVLQSWHHLCCKCSNSNANRNPRTISNPNSDLHTNTYFDSINNANQDTHTEYNTNTDVVNYPFNPHFISYTPIETLQFLILSDFILFIGQEYEYYATYEIPPNNELNGFPSANIWLPIIWDRLAIPAFCRYYPYAKLLHDDEKLLEENNYSYSLDFTFLEAQTLVGVDCADVDISMFPVPKHTPFPWNIK